MNSSLKTLVIFFLLLCFLFASCFLAVRSIYTDKINSLYNEQVIEAAKTLEDNIISHLESERAGMAYLMNTLPAAYGREASAKNFEYYLTTFTNIREIIAVDTKGYSWFAKSKTETLPNGANYSYSPTVQTPLHTGTNYVGQLYAEELESLPVMDISAPIKNPETNKIEGVLWVKFALGFLHEIADSYTGSKFGVVIINNSNGDILAESGLKSDSGLIFGRAASGINSENGVVSVNDGTHNYLCAHKAFAYQKISLSVLACTDKDQAYALSGELLRQYTTASFILFLLAFPAVFLVFRAYCISMDKLSCRLKKQVHVLDVQFTENLENKEKLEYVETFIEAALSTIEKLNKALEDSGRSISEIVEKRTERLKMDINELQRKLKEEYSKNSKKDQMMIRQSRLAAMGEMISNIAHQWRQPLNALALTIQDIEDSFRHNEVTDEYINDTVEKSMELIQHMSTTIDDFRNFYKANKDIVEFSMKKAIDEAMKIISASLKNSSIEVSINCVHDVTAKGYPNEFSQVILNILSNCKDALLDNRASGRKIEITVDSLASGKGVITITDNGGGIPANVIESVFDPYFTTKEQGRGTGIGLYMSKTIIENNMGGKIDISNVNEGTRVTLEL
jgi:signal transduction histidine kinase